MTLPAEELPDVADAAHAVVQQARTGVWVFGGGLTDHRRRAWLPPTGRSPTARGAMRSPAPGQRTRRAVPNETRPDVLRPAVGLVRG